MTLCFQQPGLRLPWATATTQKLIGSVDVEQGEWELCQPKRLDPWHIRHGWIAPSPASRRPIRAQLGAPNSRASGPRFLRTLHQTVPRAWRQVALRSPSCISQTDYRSRGVTRESHERVTGHAWETLGGYFWA